jgi:hypothetical protein
VSHRAAGRAAGAAIVTLSLFLISPPVPLTGSQASGPRVGPLAPASSVAFRTVASSDGARVAMRGSRFVIMIDGEEGQPFDRVLGGPLTPGTGTGRPAVEFGPVGRRMGYVGIRDTAAIAVTDGQEGPPFREIRAMTTPGLNQGRRFWFSQDGRRIAYVGADGNSEVAVIDGMPGPRFAQIDLTQFAFAGSQLSYVARKQDARWYGITGSRESGPYDQILNFRVNADGHVAFVGVNGNTWSIVVDGTAGLLHKGPAEGFGGEGNLVLAPTTARTAYVVVNGAASGVPRSDVIIDGRAVVSAPGVLSVVFSLDASRWAAIVGDGPGGRARKVVSQAWTSPVYEGVEALIGGNSGEVNLRFSPDSKRLAFVARNGAQMFLVVDEKESAGYGRIQNFRFGPNGRYAFEAFAQQWQVVVEGREGPKIQNLANRSLTLSPNGNRFAYAGMRTGTSPLLAIDAELQSIRVSQFQARLAAGVVRPLSFLFSPDSRRLAYVREAGDGRGGRNVVVDGQAGPTGNLFSLPAFSADSRRFAYAMWSDRRWSIVVDGKATLVDGDLFEVPNGLAFQSDGGLRYLAVKDGIVHRIVIR